MSAQPDITEAELEYLEVPGLPFLVMRTLNSGKPELCYSQELIRAVAAAPGQQQRDITARFTAKYVKDFSPRRFAADVRDALASLTAASDTKLILSSNGTPRPNLANAITALADHLHVGWDEFSQRTKHLKASPWKSTPGQPWTDLDDILCAEWLQHKGVNVGGDVASQAATAIAHKHAFHPVRDWLRSLQWDGESRLSHWLADCLGAPNNAYTQQVGKFWMLSAVARAFNPGCKVDTMLVLEGMQGKLKSMGLRMLTNGHGEGHGLNQWFQDNLPDIDHQDIGTALQGVWIVEFGELDAIRGREWTSTKKFISRQTERFRKAYGRNIQEYPRQCVFAGSTNEDKWMNDPTGGRRFWAVPVTRVDIDRILRLRDQLWAEAVASYTAGEKWFGDEEFEALARHEISERAEDDPWDPIVMRWLDDQQNIYLGPVSEFRTTPEAILENALGKRKGDMSRGDTMKLGHLMRKNGWVYSEVRDEGIKRRFWIRKDSAGNSAGNSSGDGE